MNNKYLKDYPEVSEKTIWNFRQNNPELVIRDAREHLKLDEEQCEALRIFMLARGINKWLKVRRDLIAYKKMIKHTICIMHKKLEQHNKNIKQTTFKSKEFYVLSSERKIIKKILNIITNIRHDLKVLCNSDRWVLWPEGHCSKKVVKQMNTIKAKD